MPDDLKEKIEEFSLKFKKQFEELKQVLLDKLGRKSKEDLDEEEFDDDDDGRTIVQDIGADLEKSFNTTSSLDKEGELSESDVDVDDEGKTKEQIQKDKRSKLIKGFVILIIAYLAIDEFFLKKEVDNEVLIDKKSKIRKKRKPRRKRKRNIVERKDRLQKELIQKKARPIEKNVVLEKKKNIPQLKEVRKVETIKPKTKPKANPKPNPIPNPKLLEKVKENAQTSEELSTKAMEKSKPKTLLKNTVKSLNIDKSKIKVIEKKIKERKEYESPNYERVGRGLVYNCKGKHWACVDKKNYFACKSNEEWAKQSKKKLECKPMNVYASFEDCREIQFYNINTNKPTEFCSSEESEL